MLARAGGAVVLPDAACTAEGLAAVVEPMLADRDHLGDMGRALVALARPDAAAAVAELAARHALPLPGDRVSLLSGGWPRRLPVGRRLVGERSPDREGTAKTEPVQAHRQTADG
jgi:hypothetical protein